MNRQIKDVGVLKGTLTGQELVEIQEPLGGLGSSKHTNIAAIVAAIVALVELPTIPVVSVQGRQGNVVLDKEDIGLESVDNTSDADKPVSTAQQGALDEKADLSGADFSGAISAPAGTIAGFSIIHTGNFPTQLYDTLTMGTGMYKAYEDGQVKLASSGGMAPAVLSVNGQEGIVVLTTDDIEEGDTKKFFVEAPVDGKAYTRKDEDWEEASAANISYDGTGSGIPAATVQEAIDSLTGGSGWDFSPPTASMFPLTIGTVRPKIRDNSYVGLILEAKSPVTGDVTRAIAHAIPNPTGNWDVMVRIRAIIPYGGYHKIGLVFGNAANSKAFHVCIDSRRVLYAGVFNLPAGYAGAEFQIDPTQLPSDIWFRGRKVAGGLYPYWSADGKVWRAFTNDWDITAHMGGGAGTLDKVGIGFGINGTRTMNASVPYYNFTEHTGKLKERIVSYWDFEGHTAAATAAYIGGMAGGGTLTYPVGKVGTAVVNTAAMIGAPPITLVRSDTVALGGWIKFNASAVNIPVAVRNGSGSFSEALYLVYLGSGTIQGAIRPTTGSASDIYTPTYTFPGGHAEASGALHHVILRLQDGKLSLFVNGVNVGETATAAIPATTNEIVFGYPFANVYGNTYDEWFISAGITDAQVTWLYNSGNGRSLDEIEDSEV